MSPIGLIVLETTGHKTGLPRRVPLLPGRMGGHVVVSTIRVRQSQWLRNVLQTPHVQYWLRGQKLRDRSVVVMPDREVENVSDEETRCLADALRRHAVTSGAAFVILDNV